MDCDEAGEGQTAPPPSRSHTTRCGARPKASFAVAALGAVAVYHIVDVWPWRRVHVDQDSADFFTLDYSRLRSALQRMRVQSISTKPIALDVVQLLVGPTQLTAIFGIASTLIFVAIVTNCKIGQWKMGSAVTVFRKLKVPGQHAQQYYRNLLVEENQSLDGEVVKFAKDLSYTLELEVLLFKYMDVVMQVPHWRDCTPDFQKQLVLSLKMRIYLPGDFVMQRGEVGRECYLVNRGTCMLYEYPTGNYEPPTTTTSGDGESSTSERSSVSSTDDSTAASSSRLPSHHEVTARDAERLKDGTYKSISLLQPGQVVGDFALLADYERSSDLRAVTHVEMCVIERDSFQMLLARYARDRGTVVARIVRHHMANVAAQGVPCEYMSMVRQIQPDASVEESIEYVSRAMSQPENDPSIIFGVSTQFFDRVEQGFDFTQNDERVHDTRGDGDESLPAVSEATASAHEADLVFTLRDLQARLRRLEEHRRQPPRVHVLVRHRRRNHPRFATGSWARATKRR